MQRARIASGQEISEAFTEISIRPGNQRPRPVSLPFTIRLVRTNDQLARAVNVRTMAYARRLPSLARALGRAESEDGDRDSVVLLAESKETLAPVGTLRIHTNNHGPTEFERELSLPQRFQGHSIAHVSRLGVIGGRAGVQVKLALFKALYRYCLATQIEWIMVTGIPPRDRDYVNLQFEDVFPNGGLVTLPSSMGIPARLLAFNVRTAEQRWRENDHPLYDFMCNQIHEDIRIFDSVSGAWANSRSARRNGQTAKQPHGLVFDVPVI
ncbi:MAG: hypothetical protein M9907_18860 [Burkholderiaceae bacterium]|nr:hypothetical protein [Burkholderiaceae bacterium]